jgi:glycosyltransferase involved in cell wall biosynthesis
MTSISPLISVIIPCYNRVHFIAQAIGSVRGQTLQDWELVIVDDGSADDLAGALAPIIKVDERIRFVRHACNRGVSAARNTGIEAARGRFIAFLDSDDAWMPSKLERQAAAVLSAPEPENVFCVTKTLLVSESRCIVRPIRGPAPGRSFGEFLYNDGGFVQSSSFFLAKSLAERFPFREDLRDMEDHLFFIEVGAAGGSYLLVDEVLTVWRNEDRPDRISIAKFKDRLITPKVAGGDPAWRTNFTLFKQVASPLFPPHVLVAAEARYLSGLMWPTSPAESIRLLLRAWLAGALTAGQVTKIFYRNALPLPSDRSRRQARRRRTPLSGHAAPTSPPT